MEPERKVRRDAVGVGLATGAYGISFGAVASAAGLSVPQAAALSLLMFTGGSQFAFVGVASSPLSGAMTAILLGTRNVMMESFYRQRLVAHGITLMPPIIDNIAEIDRIIYDELMLGKASRSAERTFKTLITVMGQAGAEAVVLGCTELEMVIDVDANVLPIYDGTRIHAEAAADWILGG